MMKKSYIGLVRENAYQRYDFPDNSVNKYVIEDGAFVSSVNKKGRV